MMKQRSKQIIITFQKFEKKNSVLYHGIWFQNSAAMMKKFRPKHFLVSAETETWPIPVVSAETVAET